MWASLVFVSSPDVASDSFLKVSESVQKEYPFWVAVPYVQPFDVSVRIQPSWNLLFFFVIINFVFFMKTLDLFENWPTLLL